MNIQSSIVDFSAAELRLAEVTLLERYGRAVPIETGEAEIDASGGGVELSTCPVLYWEERGAHFVVFKVANDRYRAQFFYTEAQQFSTGKATFDNLGDCLITVLQVQSDHERQMQGVRSGSTAKDFDDYDGPLVI